jgi:LacI family transcriptional regulator
MVGVSIQTISAVINNKPGITEDTKARVVEVIQQLNYRPDFIARSLRTRKTKTIALLASDISTPVASKMASAAEAFAFKLGYKLIVYNTHDDEEREIDYINSSTQGSVDGVLLISAVNAQKAQDILGRVSIPSVAIDRIPFDYEGPSVTLNNVKAGYLAGQHLVALHHSKIVHITGPQDLRVSVERSKGFIQALAEQGISVDYKEEHADGWYCENGYEIMRRVLNENAEFTAIFASGDSLAIGVLRAIIEYGYRVPDDISLIGVDDIDFAAYLNPPLTTIKQPISEMAETGVKALIDILAGKESIQKQVRLDPMLIVRASTRECNS